jgi:hypothetical protein
MPHKFVRAGTAHFRIVRTFLAGSDAISPKNARISPQSGNADDWHIRCSPISVRLARRGVVAKAERTKGAVLEARSDMQKEPVMASGIKTSSMIAKMYLTRIRGRRVAYRIIRPRFVLPGVVVYSSTWVLVPA